MTVLEQQSANQRGRSANGPTTGVDISKRDELLSFFFLGLVGNQEGGNLLSAVRDVKTIL